MATATKKSAPWEKGNPKAKAGKSKHLTTAQKSKAKASAKKAGRPYPSLVDNMNAAKKKKPAVKKPAARKKTTKKPAAKKPGPKKTATRKKAA